ncbi:MAG: HEAT repeat domain-containing protein [Thermoleophilaceae bacterium]|nr:HEAT repeat domain-containing protein [Thermoleophilaceae bacterium]
MKLARLFGVDKPNVKSLAKEGDIEGLVEAARYRDVVRRVDGRSSDAGAAVREAAVLALAKIGGDRADETLIRALGDPADRVRCAAIVALHDRGDDASLAMAAAHLREEDGQALPAAFRALLELQKPGSTGRLVMAIVHRGDVRPVNETDGAIVRALRESEGPECDMDVVELLVSTLTDEREDVAERAEDLLELLAPESVDALIRELSFGLAPARAAAVLGRVKDARGLDSLVGGLRHDDPQVRAECCSALGELRDPAASEPLLAATRDQEHVVRAAAGAALDRIGTAAIAVGVAALLRPLLETSPAHSRQELAAHTVAALQSETAGDANADGQGSTLLRRLARFIDRVEDSRGRGREEEPSPARAVSTHHATGVEIALSHDARRPHTSTADAAAPVAWPSSHRRSSASLNGR